MTLAVCIFCGEIKFGAWVTCPACGKGPVGVDEVAKSVIASDHHLTPEGFKAIGEAVKQKLPWHDHPQFKTLVDRYREDYSDENGELDFSKVF